LLSTTPDTAANEPPLLTMKLFSRWTLPPVSLSPAAEVQVDPRLPQVQRAVEALDAEALAVDDLRAVDPHRRRRCRRCPC
jgi:hypothetical protein